MPYLKHLLSPHTLLELASLALLVCAATVVCGVRAGAI